jgi:hypothetical protein
MRCTQEYGLTQVIDRAPCSNLLRNENPLSFKRLLRSNKVHRRVVCAVQCSECLSVFMIVISYDSYCYCACAVVFVVEGDVGKHASGCVCVCERERAA